jgi:hypothetical protein
MNTPLAYPVMNKIKQKDIPPSSSSFTKGKKTPL